jgi:protocatechuate 3,4-dioxygenase beta subunit
LSTTVGARYARPLQVKLTDTTGAPLGGVSVIFSLGSGGGAGASGAGAGSAGASFPGGSAQTTETTNASGVATSPWFDANATAGTFTATATVSGVTNPAVFTLVNLAGKPPTIKSLGPAKRSATVDSRYSRPLEVKLTDRKGKPLQGESVTFTLGDGAGGSGAVSAGASFVGGSAQATETTNASGLATSPRFEANATAGTFTATATVAGSNAAASFQLANLAGRPPTLKTVGPHRLRASIDTRYRHPLEVRVLDRRGKPLQAQMITFTLGAAGDGSAGAGGTGSGSAGASFPGGSAQATATTNTSGIATSPRFEANTTAGAFTATAAVAGSNAITSIQLDNLAGPPDAVTAGAGATESTGVGGRFPIPLAITVTDKHDNPVAGALVTFTAPTGGAGGTFLRPRHRHSHAVHVRTNASGIAIAPAFTANRTAGGYIVKATVKGAAPAAFALVNQPPGQ